MTFNQVLAGAALCALAHASTGQMVTATAESHQVTASATTHQVTASATTHAGTASATAQTTGGASTHVGPGGGQLTLHGEGAATLLGDKLEATKGIVRINGSSYGAFPAGAEIKYVVNGDSRALYVNGKRRAAVAKK